MATINITAQSLLNSATFLSYTANNAATVNTLKSTIATAEGTNTAWFDLVLNSNVLVGTDTLAAAGVVNGSQLYLSNNVANLGTREARQVAKLSIAQLRRRAGGNISAPYYRTLNTYDLTELPTYYSGNTLIDNPNPGGLVAGRPWKSLPVIALD